MTAELLVVEGVTLKFQEPLYSGTFIIQPALIPIPPAVLPSVLSNSVKSGENKAYFVLSFYVTGFTDGASIVNGYGPGVIMGSTTKCKGNGNSFVLEIDTTTMIITYPNPPPPGNLGTLVDVVVEVDNPGQSVVRMI